MLLGESGGRAEQARLLMSLTGIAAIIASNLPLAVKRWMKPEFGR